MSNLGFGGRAGISTFRGGIAELSFYRARNPLLAAGADNVQSTADEIAARLQNMGIGARGLSYGSTFVAIGTGSPASEPAPRDLPSVAGFRTLMTEVSQQYAPGGLEQAGVPDGILLRQRNELLLQLGVQFAEAASDGTINPQERASLDGLMDAISQLQAQLTGLTQLRPVPLPPMNIQPQIDPGRGTYGPAQGSLQFQTFDQEPTPILTGSGESNPRRLVNLGNEKPPIILTAQPRLGLEQTPPSRDDVDKIRYQLGRDGVGVIPKR